MNQTNTSGCARASAHASAHVSPLLVDYVLGLLPETERQRVEQHATTCAACRAALQKERAVVGLVQNTLAAAGQIDNGRLRQLRPAAPTPTGASRSSYPRLALAALTAVLLLSILGWGYGRAHPGWQLPLGTYAAATATATHEATATLAEIVTRAEPTAVTTLPANPQNRSTIPASPTPAPQPTPIAAIRPPLAAN